MSMDKIKNLISWLRDKPLWFRAVLLLISAILVFLLSVSCGQTVRVTIKDTPNGVSISTSQNKRDSSGTNININPNINLNGND